jgi:CheY-like chemotaxis protein
MSKNILFIESDAPFARAMTAALEEKGFVVRLCADGKEGVDLARDLRPDAIVLCVELPKMSGYSVCNKLKKDDKLRSIPLVIISAEASPETFEQHKKLKTRAEDYLIKPFAGDTLVERLGALVGLPETPSDEEVVTLADVELEALGGLDAGDVARLHAPAPAGGRPAPAIPEEDEDLRMLDNAFESIAAGRPWSGGAGAVAGGEVPAKASMPEADEGPARADLDALGNEADAALAALAAGEDEPSTAPARAAAVPAARASALRAAGIPVLEPEGFLATPPSHDLERLERELAEARRLAEERKHLAEERQRQVEERQRQVEEYRSEIEARQREGEQRDAELRELRQELEGLRAKAQEAEREMANRDGELTQARGDLKRLEADLTASREEARRGAGRAAAAEKDLAGMQTRIEQAERAAAAKGAEAMEILGRAGALERQLDGLRTELVVARGEVEGAHTEAEKRLTDTHGRLQELEAANAKNEERVVKAYQKIKGDEKLREKARKALTIALQLLDERAPAPAEPADKERAAARE